MTPDMTRRTFLRAAAVALSAAAPSPAAEAKAPVVDAHLHCFAGPDDRRFPYHKDGPYRPEAATPEQLLKLMDGAGVDYAIVVHPEPYQDDHRYLEHCLEVGKGRLKGTCLFFAGREKAREQMAALVKKCPVVALRIHAYAPERLPPFGKPELKELWKAAADLGLAVQLHFEPRYAPGFEPLIKEFADTTVIIDHLGRPIQGSPEEHAVVVKWSRFKNTYMKLSALPSTREYPHRDVKPIVKQLADAYGADRLLYGGGFGSKATAESYRAAREEVRACLEHLSAAEQAQVLGGTAAKLFKLGERG
jgi:predicted TIM-barrel fold metal-dependent hydrolase